jgi:hypothetical protein
MRAIVTDGRTLKGMTAKGYIVYHGGSDRHWTGRRVKVCYVEDCGPKLEHWYDVFTYRGVEYRLRYFDGCFKPFVTRLDCALNLPTFV